MSAIAVPPTLLEKHKLLGAVVNSKWATRIDHKIIWHIIERYWAKFSCARVSLSYLVQATGYQKNKITPSLRRLEKERVITVLRKGAGTRPTEYDLNFSYGKIASGSENGPTTLGCPNGTLLGSELGPSTTARGAQPGTETYLRSPSIDGLTVSMTDTPAVPSAPPVAGLPPASADAAVDLETPKTPFDELYDAYPRKYQIGKARDAYNKLAPSQELHAEILLAAKVLAEHHRQDGTEPQYIKGMSNWIAEGTYREDPSHRPSFKSKPISSKDPEPKPTGAMPDKIGLTPKTPTGQHQVEIIGFEIDNVDAFSDSTLRFTYRIMDGKSRGTEFSHKFYTICNNNEADQVAGQNFFADIRKATGVLEPEDTSDFHGKTLRAIVSKGSRIKYEKTLG